MIRQIWSLFAPEPQNYCCLVGFVFHGLLCGVLIVCSLP